MLWKDGVMGAASQFSLLRRCLPSRNKRAAEVLFSALFYSSLAWEGGLSLPHKM